MDDDKVIKPTEGERIVSALNWTNFKSFAPRELATTIDTALAAVRAETWKDAIKRVRETNPSSVSDSADEAWAYLKRKIITALEAAAQEEAKSNG